MRIFVKIALCLILCKCVVGYYLEHQNLGELLKQSQKGAEVHKSVEAMSQKLNLNQSLVESKRKKDDTDELDFSKKLEAMKKSL